MTTRTITGTVLQPNGTAYTDSINFGLRDDIISSSVVVPKYVVNVITNSSGVFSVTLYVPDTGTATYTVTLPDGYSQDFELASGASTDLSTIMTVETSAATPSALQVIIDAHAASTTTHENLFIPTDPLILGNLVYGNGGRLTTRSAPNPTDPLPFESNGSYNGLYNTFVGTGAGLANTSGNCNTSVGYNAGVASTIATQSTFIGMFAGMSIVDGYHNTFIGAGAGEDIVSGNYNVYIGADCGLSATGGNNNTVVGTGAGAANTTGNNNTFVGLSAGAANTTGSSNLFIGAYSGFVNTTGNQNTAFGENSLAHNIGANYNVALGSNALHANVTGPNQVAIGYHAGESLSAYNSDSIMIGYYAGAFQANGTTPLASSAYSVYIGSAAKGKDDNDSNSIVLGWNAIGKGTNTVVIGNSLITANYFTGSVLVGTATDGMTAGGSMAIAKDLAHRGTLAGFYNHAPATQPAKASHNNWAAIGDVVAALVEIGLLDAA